MAKDAQPTTESFEDVYGRLQAKVELLEKGGLPLDDAIALYEEGMLLARECQERLDAAEQKITRLKESFAPIGPTRGTAVNDSPDDYEYVGDDEPPEAADDAP